MNHNENQLQEPTKSSGIRKFFHLPAILKIDFDKPVPFKQQFAIMGTVLVISCLLFTVVYMQQLLSGNVMTDEEKAKAAAPASASEQGSNKNTENSIKETSQKPEKRVTKIASANKAILKEMTTVLKNQDDVYTGPLILVNKNYPSRLDGENVQLLFEEMTDNYILSDYTVGIDKDSVEPFNRMMNDFASIYGKTDIMVACGYRSRETQEELMSTEEANDEQADQWVAPPGYSEHQTGLAFDFDLNLSDGGKAGINYDGEGDYSWINNNCGQYGFILRYRENREDVTGYLYEPWHFRYVGLPHAQYIEDHDITLEEYMAFLHTHTTENAILMEDHDGTQWCIYYVPADEDGETNVPVPKNYSFEISGDNMVNDSTEGYGGYIVTVMLGSEEETGIKMKEESVEIEYSVNDESSTDEKSFDNTEESAIYYENDEETAYNDDEETDYSEEYAYNDEDYEYE